MTGVIARIQAMLAGLHGPGSARGGAWRLGRGPGAAGGR